MRDYIVAKITEGVDHLDLLVFKDNMVTHFGIKRSCIAKTSAAPVSSVCSQSTMDVTASLMNPVRTAIAKDGIATDSTTAYTTTWVFAGVFQSVEVRTA